MQTICEVLGYLFVGIIGFALFILAFGPAILGWNDDKKKGERDGK